MSKSKSFKAKIAVCYCLHDDACYLAPSIHAAREAGDPVVVCSRLPWHDAPGPWEAAAEAARQAGAAVILGDWTREHEQRNAALQGLLKEGYSHAVLLDGDEILEPRLRETLVRAAHSRIAERLYGRMDTYWFSPEHVIRPREELAPVLLVSLPETHFVQGRIATGGRSLLLTAEHGVVHHLSYVGPDERIRRKLATFSHREEVAPGWDEHIWLGWQQDRLMGNLHPTHPEAYGFGERIPVPEVLEGAMARYRELAGEPEPEPLTPAVPWPTLSVILPAHGGSEDLRACLESLLRSADRIHEIVVIDNDSPDDAAHVAESFPGVRVIRNATNRGYPAACNQGIAATTGEVVLFLNSDTLVPQAGLIGLIEALMPSGSIAAAGPLSNRVGHFQQTPVTYTDRAHIDLFAQVLARRLAADQETDMLVGFGLAVKRSVLEEVGLFDEQFGLGLFEDNDLSHRLRRAGYRLVIASRSFIHHEGSKTFARTPGDAGALFERNRRLYEAKWRADVESGFASHLAGLGPERIVFDPAKHPDLQRQQIAEMARRADISLCMIVKNEERVIGDCLDSFKDFVKEMILVDTGSTDTTRDIAAARGAKVFDFPWTKSFSEGRNESLRHASGHWILWADADDTLWG